MNEVQSSTQFCTKLCTEAAKLFATDERIYVWILHVLTWYRHESHCITAVELIVNANSDKIPKIKFQSVNGFPYSHSRQVGYKCRQNLPRGKASCIHATWYENALGLHSDFHDHHLARWSQFSCAFWFFEANIIFFVKKRIFCIVATHHKWNLW